ncbi:MAG: hypothetical protein U0736_08215 [Gemmataceae bacterium]
MFMDAVLIATGFTGALTVVWLARLVGQLFRKAVSVAVSFAPGGGCTDVLVREIGAGRREVLVLAGQLANRTLAQALVDARLRGVNVELVLAPMNATNPGSDLAFLKEQGLEPLLGKPGLLHHFVLIDGRTLLSASFPFVSRADTDLVGNLLVVRGHAELLQACREEFVRHRELIREAAPLPAPTATAPIVPAPTPPPVAPTPAPAAVVPAPVAPTPSTPAVVVPPAVTVPAPADREPRLPLSATFPTPNTPPAIDRPLPRPVEEPIVPAPTFSRPILTPEPVGALASGSDDAAEAGEREERPAPRLTAASADLFARVRKQLAEMPEMNDGDEKAA